jgi:hypothetical protein
MQDCIKCGSKAKKLYERHGESAVYEFSGYFLCHKCGSIFALDQKNLESGLGTSLRPAIAEKPTIVLAAQTVCKVEQDRLRQRVAPQTVSSKPTTAEPCDLVHENEWGGYSWQCRFFALYFITLTFHCNVTSFNV